MSLEGALLQGTVVRVELAGLPSLDIDLSETLSGPPNPLVAAMRPRVTVWRQGTQLIQSAPYGDPAVGVPWGLIAVAVIVVALCIGMAWVFT